MYPPSPWKEISSDGNYRILHWNKVLFWLLIYFFF
jgi:hypothetical protein